MRRICNTMLMLALLGAWIVAFSFLLEMDFHSVVRVQNTDCLFCNHGPSGIHIVIDREVAPLSPGKNAEGGSLVRGSHWLIQWTHTRVREDVSGRLISEDWDIFFPHWVAWAFYLVMPGAAMLIFMKKRKQTSNNQIQNIGTNAPDSDS